MYKFLSVAFFAFFLGTAPVLAGDVDDAEEQTRIARDMVKALQAYAVYKMGQYDEAFERYCELADRGNSQGILNVANMYAAGLGTEKDLEKAFEWYLRAAEKGEVIGMEAVADAYREGLGVAQSSSKADHWQAQARVARQK
ncbi:sel1 repeat family protein [Marinobacter sp.]|uniref:tetratricopeptide repeat protein n=1 Tax=Marinobacter sp. TaxID=50741 RepID=UPI001A0EBA8B|nr:sel1 repeat family protein [Marinobacter sp.]MBE0486992.1 sel1 repeat family protein [Marinobacter sp.]